MSPTSAKYEQVLDYFRRTGTAHSMKDLERTLPAVALISVNQVKDYLQVLTDNGRLRMEKIGSGHWYWCFVGEEKKECQRAIEVLNEEKEDALAVITSLHRQIEAADNAGERRANGYGYDRADMVRTQVSLQREVACLRSQVDSYSHPDPADAIRRMRAGLEARMWAERRTENINLLEPWVFSVMDLSYQDYHEMEALRLHLYGDDYREGEGLTRL